MNGQTSDFEQPSERDLEIFAAVKIDCRRQVDVAAEFGLCQARVSQIVQAVRNWQMRSAHDDELTKQAGPYVERQLDLRRLEWLYENTIQCYRRSCEPARAERRECQGRVVVHLHAARGGQRAVPEAGRKDDGAEVEAARPRAAPGAARNHDVRPEDHPAVAGVRTDVREVRGAGAEGRAECVRCGAADARPDAGPEKRDADQRHDAPATGPGGRGL